METGNKAHDAELAPAHTRRQDLIDRLAEPHQYDIAIIGGGATGLGVALDAAARGFSVVLVESHDFAKGTSSRATKLVHGGVRYLAQGNISLVREALHERTTLLANAPHLAQPLPFVMPSYKFWEAPFYGVGLKMYDALAGKAGLGATEFLSRQETLACLPTVQPQHLKGGVKYWDGQFDDARLALALARTAARQGALLVNYCEASGLIHEDGKLVGLHARDQETGRTFEIRAGCVVNAAGVWVDQFRLQDGQATGRNPKPMVAPSQGVHIVVDRSFLPTDHALLVPKTADGRVLFAVPWLGKTILGTTDTPRHDLAREPLPFKDEVDFILRESARYLSRAPGPADIKSIWVGLRPLVKPPDDDAGSTQALSREHTVLVSKSGLVTVTGGKWTTYRAMAEDVLAKCADAALLSSRPSGATTHLKLVGANSSHHKISETPGIHLYGSEAAAVEGLPGAGRELGGGLTEAMVRFAARHEYARTVEDVLARRSRLLFLDAALARTLAPEVAALLQEENGIDPKLEAFVALCAQYLALPV
ncbi:glycerol-3-phosphate dehydrogenase/oxidase [Polaromonas sp.]|uniref:glycerol-3-phosphate dehydrogenase/oxidase n=1 Tax=Polaromonas sp. TaxID=1869339 RepID=UPI003267DFC2